MPSSLASTATAAAVGPAFAIAAADVGGAGGEHRPHRAAASSPNAAERLVAAGRARPPRPAASSRRASRPGARRPRAPPAAERDRLEHQRVERALAHLAGDQAAQPGLLVGGGAAEQRADQLGRARACEPGAGQRRDRPRRPSCTSATVSDGGRRPARAASVRPRQPSPVRRWRSAPAR